MRESVSELVVAAKELGETPAPSLGLDLDGTIDEAPIFFQILSNVWPGRVYILTYTDNRQQAQERLAEFGIRYDELITVDSFDAKAEVIAEKGILVYFDDQPEMLKNIPPGVNVMLMRNGGNFDFADKLWMLSARTGRLV